MPVALSAVTVSSHIFADPPEVTLAVMRDHLPSLLLLPGHCSFKQGLELLLGHRRAPIQTEVLQMFYNIDLRH
eukprot:12922633-Prorocentrum_lima.AAC.1